MKNLRWRKVYHADGTLGSVEAEVSWIGHPGLVDTYTAIILVGEDRHLAYIRMPHGQSARWARRPFPSLAMAQRWARERLRHLVGID